MASEDILHFNAVRLRVTGSGSLDMVFKSLDDVITKTLAPLAMSMATGREPRVLTNFKSQRAKLEISVDLIDEYFSINKLIVFVKPLWADYPG